MNTPDLPGATPEQNAEWHALIKARSAVVELMKRDAPLKEETIQAMQHFDSLGGFARLRELQWDVCQSSKDPETVQKFSDITVQVLKELHGG